MLILSLNPASRAADVEILPNPITVSRVADYNNIDITFPSFLERRETSSTSQSSKSGGRHQKFKSYFLFFLEKSGTSSKSQPGPGPSQAQPPSHPARARPRCKAPNYSLF